MSFEFPAGNSGKNFTNIVVKDRIWDAIFKSYSIKEGVLNPYTGETDTRVTWVFEVRTKSQGVVELVGFTSAKWGSAEKPSNGRKWMAALQGLDVTREDLSHKMDDFVGKPCQVQTKTRGEGENLRSLVVEVFPADDEDEEDEAPAKPAKNTRTAKSEVEEEPLF